jgi:hypothetical protein
MSGANCIDFATLVPSTSVALGLDSTNASPRLPAAAKGVIITVEGVDIRWRADGTAATTGIGHELTDGSSLTFDSWSEPQNNWRQVLKNFSMMSGATSGTLSISYFD